MYVYGTYVCTYDARARYSVKFEFMAAVWAECDDFPNKKIVK